MEVNYCSPIWSIRPKDQFPVLMARKIIMSELLIMFLLYWAFDIYSDWKRKSQDKDMSPTHDQYKWRDSCTRCFADHLIGVGFALGFSPYPFEIILALTHLIMFVAFLFGEIQHKWWKDSLRMSMRLVNMTLMLCAMVGISRCDQHNGLCDNPLYQK